MKAQKLAALSVAASAAALASTAPVVARAAVEPAHKEVQEEQPPQEAQSLPVLTVEGGFGLLGFPGGAAAAGPSWNVRVTRPVTPRFAAEVTYTGSANRRPFLDSTLVYTSLDAGARIDLFQHERLGTKPFVTVGLGWAGYSGEQGDGAALVVPLGVGVERPLGQSAKTGLRFQYRPAFFADLGGAPTGSPAGGDTWCLTAYVGGLF